jgi:Domain of unknown function (DUF4362)
VKALAVLVACLALAGCGGDDDAETEGAPADAGVEDCGSYESLNEPVTAEQREMNRCLLDAVAAARPAELVVTLATVEGDPITHYFTVTDTGEIEVLVDATKDKFGDGRWHSSTCTVLSEDDGRLSWTGCTETEVPKDLPETNPHPPS